MRVVPEVTRNSTGAPARRVRVESSRGEGGLDVSVVMPCLNEEETVAYCVKEAFSAIAKLGLRGEVIVVDNDSSDRSAEFATLAGAKVVIETRRGYGSAFHRGFEEARAEVLVLADSDGSHSFDDMERLIEPLRNGADFVLGSRVQGVVQPGAIPWLHRYVGGPFLTALLNALHGTRVSDANCGMRSITKSALTDMRLSSTGMEFASEMIIEAANRGVRIAEVPIGTAPRAGGESKLRTWRDGCRHLWLIVGRARGRAASVGLAGMAAATGLFALVLAAGLEVLGLILAAAVLSLSGGVYVFARDTGSRRSIAWIDYRLGHVGEAEASQQAPEFGA